MQPGKNPDHASGGAQSRPVGCTLCQPMALEQLLKTHPEAAAVWAALPRVTLCATHELLRAGETLERCWWVEHGLLRSYYLDANGVENNRAFHCEGDWVGHGLPPLAATSPYHLQALEPSTLVVLPYPTLRTLLHRFSALQPLLDEANNSILSALARREASLLGQTPAQRYQAFLASHAHLQNRVPLNHVASYLGVSNVSLSRIRARLGLLSSKPVCAPAPPVGPTSRLRP